MRVFVFYLFFIFLFLVSFFHGLIRSASMNNTLKSSRGRKPHRNLSRRQLSRISKEIKGNSKKIQTYNAGESSHFVDRSLWGRQNSQGTNKNRIDRIPGAKSLADRETRQDFNANRSVVFCETSTNFSDDISDELIDRVLTATSSSMLETGQEIDRNRGLVLYQGDDIYDTDENGHHSCDDSFSSNASTISEGSREGRAVENRNFRTVGTFRDKLASCFVENNLTNKAIDNILKVLRLTESLAYLPKCARTLLGTPRQPVQLREVAPGFYLHLGVQAAIVEILRNVHPREIPVLLKIDFSTDGANIDNSGNNPIWPIQCRISNAASSKTEVIGIYRGKKKPDDAIEFFHDFIEETDRILSDGGIIFDGKKIPITLRSFIADAPARALILNHMGHNSYNPCSKCKVCGTVRDRRMMYDGIDHILRTDDEYVRKTDEDHHKDGVSPLSFLPFGMVTRVPFEYMHLVCLGAVKRLLSAWVHGKFTMLSKLSGRQMQLISGRLEYLKKCYPQEFARPPRQLEDYHHYKATEFRQFLLYTGPVVLYGIVQDDVYKHFLLLTSAMRVLISAETSEQLLEFAYLALRIFVARSVTLYGPTFVSYNIHGLLHVVADVKLLGPVDTYSAFPYENNMMIFRQYCRKPDLPLQQIANRRAERANVINLSKPRTSVPVLAVDLHATGPLPVNADANLRQYCRLKTPKFIFTRTKRDRCCILKNRSICIVRNFVVIENRTYLVVQKFGIIESFYDVGIPSTSVSFYKCSLLQNDLSFVSFDDVHTKGYLMPYWAPSRVDLNEREQPVVDTFIVASLSSPLNH